MKKIILSAIISVIAFGAYPQHPAGKPCCDREKACCDSVATNDRAIILTYLDKLKESYVNQDLGFLMSILDVDQSAMNDLYNEFMDEEILDAAIEDITICSDSNQKKSFKSSFKLSRKGHNFSDNKYVSILWDFSDPNQPKIVDVTTENID